MSDFERSMRRLTISQTIVAIVTCLILGLQFNEMRTGSRDTHDLAVAAKAQSDASKAIAESSKSESEATQAIAASTKDEVDQLKASVSEAHAATLHADLSLQKSERPWVNAESIQVHGLVFPNDNRPVENVSSKTILRNTGRSIAVNGWHWQMLLPNYTALVINERWREPCQFIGKSKIALAQSQKAKVGSNWPIGFVLAPGQTAEENMGFGTTELTTENTRNGYYVLGCMTYDDQFGNHHHTTYCFQVAGAGATPDAPRFRACIGFAEAN